VHRKSCRTILSYDRINTLSSSLCVVIFSRTIKHLFCKENEPMLAYNMADSTVAENVGIGRIRVDFSI
jgi:hypothetical protein